MVPPALFGDAFGTRGDYSKGVFYAGRRKFELGPAANSLKPPDYFLSREQRQRQIRSLKNSGERVFQKLDFKKDEDVKDGQPVRKRNSKIVQKAAAQRARGLEPADWTKEFQAGVHFWRNHVTGEVQASCPWGEDESVVEVEAESSLIDDALNDPNADGDIDNPELSQLFELLDKEGAHHR